MSKCKASLDGNKITRIQVKTKAVSSDQLKQGDASSTQKPLGDSVQQPTASKSSSS
jgi:hypothetical protein